MKVIVLTSTTAKPIIEELVSRSRAVREGSLEVVVHALPVAAIGILNARSLAALLRRHPPPRGDLILVPGSVEGDASLVEQALGVPAFKASRDPGLLPVILDHLAEGGRLSRSIAAEDYLRLGRPRLQFSVAFTIGGVPVAERGPPLVLAAEIPASAGDPDALAERYIGEGAEIIVVGHSGDPGYTRIAEGLVERLSRAGIPVLAEAPSDEDAGRLVEAGALGVLVSPATALKLPSRVPGDTVVVVGDRDPGLIGEAVRKLREHGFTRLMADPVVGVPLVDFSATAERYKLASKLGVPLWFSAANVATSLEADTHGVYAVLASLAAELRASVFLVVEDQYHTIHAAAEARAALDLVADSWARRSPPLGLGASRLLVVKQRSPPPPSHLDPEGARMAPDYVEPRLEEGYFVISVDHERGLIIVEYRGRDGTRKWAGRRARGLMRTIVRETGIGSEHAAYLGMELYKAELALRLGKTYVQDWEVLQPAWEE